MEVANQLRKEGHEVALAVMFGHLLVGYLGGSRARVDASRLAGRVSARLFQALTGVLRRRVSYAWLDVFRRGAEKLVAQAAIRRAAFRYVIKPYSGARFVAAEDRRGHVDAGAKTEVRRVARMVDRR